MDLSGRMHGEFVPMIENQMQKNMEHEAETGIM